MDPPVDPPWSFERVPGRSKPRETVLDNGDTQRLPGDEHPIFSRVLSLDMGVQPRAGLAVLVRSASRLQAARVPPTPA
jgi:hypothetical protein